MTANTQSTSPTLLAALCRDFDDEAWHLFVDRYAPAIFRWVRGAGLQDSDSADVTQEAMLKILGAIRGFDYDKHEGSFRGWLKTIAINAARDWGRAHQRRITLARNALSSDDGWDGVAEAIEQEYQREILAQASNIVGERADQQTWKVWEMLSDEGLAANEVATKLQIPIAQVYVAKSRIAKRIQRAARELVELDEQKLA